ncbi:chaplin [Streptomyces sp. NPDC049687]|uniref:chaplin n=1 Tax=Streptomyces sp. NPDC049687 TaxID=3365596 RepID=UPI00379E9FC1
MRQVTRKSLMTVAAATGVIAAAGGYAHADSGANGTATDSPGIASGNTVQAPVSIPVNVCGNTVDIIGALNPAFGNSCANKGGGHGAPGGGHRAPGGHRGGYGDDDQGYGSDRSHHGGGHHGGSGAHPGSGGAHTGSEGAYAGGYTGGSPGVASGNHVQAPIDIPVNVCGNGVDAVGLLNPSFGNDCDNGGGHDHATPPSRGHETPGKPGHQAPGKPAQPGRSNPSAPEGLPSTPGHGTPARAVGAHRPATGTTGIPAGAQQLAHTGSELPVGLALPAGAGVMLAGALIYRKARASM